MRTIGTAHLVEIMNDYDLLPTKNFRFGSHPEAVKLASWVWKEKFTQNVPDGCWFGCTMSCAHGVDNFELKTGPYKGHKVLVDGPEYETVGGCGSNPAIFDPDAVIEINFYCDTYGIDTISFGTLTGFLMDCYENGILNKERTGGLEMTWGNWRAALELMHQMARGEGFGLIAGKGVKFMQEYFVKEYGADAQFLKDIGMHGKGLEQSEYMSKESLAQQGGYYLTNKGPQHDEAWLIFMDMVNNMIPTFEKKAEALHYFPVFRTWFWLQGLVQAALERRRAGRQRQAGRAQQGARARAELRRHLQRHHRREDRQEGTDDAVGAGLQFPARLQPEDGPRQTPRGLSALPRHGAGHGRGIRVARRALRQGAAGKAEHRPGRARAPRRRSSCCASTAKRSTRA